MAKNSCTIQKGSGALLGGVLLGFLGYKIGREASKKGHLNLPFPGAPVWMAGGGAIVGLLAGNYAGRKLGGC